MTHVKLCMEDLGMIRCFTGPCFSDKSASLIDIYSALWNKEIAVAFKSKKDIRDGSFIQSKKYPGVKIEAIAVDTIEEIKDIVLAGNYKTVFIDEAQFLQGDASVLVDLSVMADVDFYIAGLNMSSEQIPFGIMADILAVSDETNHIRGYCQDCNKPSVYSYSISKEEKTEMIQVGNDYVSLCPACLRRRTLAKDAKTLSLRPRG